MKVLVTILTSSDLEILDLTFQTVSRQLISESRVTFHPLVIVNTKKEGYADLVRERLLEKYQFTNVIETTSNGKPGKGHNSAFYYFVTHPEYDWHFPMDGDDILFPTTFWQLATLLLSNQSLQDGASQPKFDVLLYLGMDRVVWGCEPCNVALTRGASMRTAFDESNHMKTEDVLSPFREGAMMNEIVVPVRICLMNRRATEVKSPRIAWDETGPALVDYPPFLAVFEHFLQGNLRVAGTSNRFLYIYNLLNLKNVTTTFHENAQNQQSLQASTENFRQVLAPFKRAKKNWEKLKTIPFVRTDDDARFLKHIPFKVDFIQNTLVKHYMMLHLKDMELVYNDKNYAEFIDMAQGLFEKFQELVTPELLSVVRLNLGVCFFNQYKFQEAIRQWRMALAICTDEGQKAILQSNILACERAQAVNKSENVPSAA